MQTFPLERLDESLHMRIVCRRAHAGVSMTRAAMCKHRREPSPKLARMEDGWKVEEHRQAGDFMWGPNRVALYFSDGQKSGKIIEGNKFRKELKGKPALNANVIDYLLAHPELILEEWRGEQIFFWGTIYRGSDGSFHVRYLCWHDGRWRWYYDWLERGWYGHYPALVPAGA